MIVNAFIADTSLMAEMLVMVIWIASQLYALNVMGKWTCLYRWNICVLPQKINASHKQENSVKRIGRSPMEFFLLEKIENELQKLYAMLDRTNDKAERQSILQAIQSRNLQVSRLFPCE
jgi:hypothetical protein